MSGYFVRKADDSLWHAASGSAHDSVRQPRCGALQWPRQPDDATRPVVAGGVFGPVCSKCSALEGM